MAENATSVVSHRLPAAAAAIGAGIVALAAPLAGQTSLSIYGDGRVVMRRSLAQPLEKGRNMLTLKLDALDPATLFSPDTGVVLVSAVLRPATDQAAALAREMGQTLSFVRTREAGGADTIRATVIRTDPPQFRLPDGRFLLTAPGEPLFPPDAIRTAPEVAITLDATRARPRTDLAYVVSGAARWEAVYQVILGGGGGGGGGKCQVTGAATIRSDSLRVDSADVQLVAGSINRARAAPAMAAYRRGAVALADVVVSGTEAGEEAVAETHVYQVPGRVSLTPGVSVTVALFPNTGAGYVQDFVVPGALPWRGFFAQSPAEPNRVPVEVWYTIKRGRGTPFGERPLPAGTVQLFQADSSGRLQLVGEASSAHTAPGRDVRVQSGDAFDITADRVQTDYNQEQLAAPKRGIPPRQRITATYKVTISNAKPEAVTVDVREARAGVWRVTDSSVPPEKLSATEMRFRVPVPAGAEATLTYTIQAES
jgi:hypothetical protein